MRRLIVPLILLSMLGCSGLARGSVDVSKIAPIDESDRQLVVLSQTPYVGDLAAELGEYGFRIRPLVRRGEVDAAATGGGSGIAVYEEARYGLEIHQRFDQACAFTSSSIYAFTVTVIDIEANEVVMVVRQTGADGPCTTVQPVWPTIAEAIAQNWNEQIQNRR